MSKKIIGATVGTPLSLAKVNNTLKPVKTVNGKTPDANGNVNFDSLKETNKGDTFSMWVGTQAEYDALPSKNAKTYYWITDKDTLDKINETLVSLITRVTNIEDGNFDDKWLYSYYEYPRLSRAGTYQFYVSVQDKDTFSTEVVTYWNGSYATVYDLCTACDTTNKKMRAWRLIISADGSTHVQYCELDIGNGNVGSWTELKYVDSFTLANKVSIDYRKIR